MAPFVNELVLGNRKRASPRSYIPMQFLSGETLEGAAEKMTLEEKSRCLRAIYRRAAPCVSTPSPS